MNTKYVALLALSAVALGGLGCERRDDRVVVERRDESPVVVKKNDPNFDLSPKGGGPVASNGEREKARDRLAAARCDHYKRCGDVASGKKYDSYDSCVTQQRASVDKDWSVDDCPRIDTPRLDACLQAMTAKKCDSLLGGMPSECAESKVCIKP